MYFYSKIMFSEVKNTTLCKLYGEKQLIPIISCVSFHLFKNIQNILYFLLTKHIFKGFLL